MPCLVGANIDFARIIQVKPIWFPTPMLSGTKFALFVHYQYLDSCILNQGHFPIMFKNSLVQNTLAKLGGIAFVTSSSR